MAIRQRYCEIQNTLVNGSRTPDGSQPFPGLHSQSQSYSFKAEDGLLLMTQFAQPAICVLEKAAFELLRSQELLPPLTAFAGHSLGEYAALSCATKCFPLRSLLKLVFVRGSIMQAAVPRDAEGRSDYGMLALGPSRIHPGKSEPRNVAVHSTNGCASKNRLH